MFCPECGSTTNKMLDDVCINCFLKDFHMLTIPEKIEINICTHCNGKLDMGKWEYNDIPIEEIIYCTLESNIKVDKLVEDEIIDLEINKVRGKISECIVAIKGKVFNKQLEEEHDVLVKINKTVCPNCSKQNSGYYEAVIQFRADSREPTSKELKKADEVVISTLNNLFNKDRLAYLVEIAKPKEGHDYYIGSYKSSKKVLKQLKDVFGGITKESPRLISEDKSTGKGLYRIWISFRIPQFKTDDFVKFQDKIAQVKSIGSSKIQCYDLGKSKLFSIPFKDYENISLIKTKKNIEKTNIISRTPKKIQILDPYDYDVVDLDINDAKLNIGDEIDIVKIENKIYFVR